MATTPKPLRVEVRLRADGRCEYCRSAEFYSGFEFEVDHVIPLSRGGETTLENLALACGNCNGHKGARTEAVDSQTGNTVRLFSPRKDAWRDHFEWGEDGLRIKGLTETGRATVDALDVNNGAQC